METYDGPAWRLIAISWSAPFQRFARRSGIQVFRLYSTPSPVTRSQCIFVIAMEICDGQGFPFSPLQCRQGMDSDAGMGGSKERCTLHAGYVVVFVVGKVWRIVPCVYKIYTLDRFQFHSLLKNNPIRFSVCVCVNGPN